MTDKSMAELSIIRECLEKDANLFENGLGFTYEDRTLGIGSDEPLTKSF